METNMAVVAFVALQSLVVLVIALIVLQGALIGLRYR